MDHTCESREPQNDERNGDALMNDAMGSCERPKKRTRRWLLWTPLSVLLVVLAAAIIAFAYLNTIARIGIEKALSHVLQVKVAVAAVEISPLRGKAHIKGFVIGNPENYKSAHAIATGQISADADIWSFRTERPVIDAIYLKDVNIKIEHASEGWNLKRLIDNASQAGGKAPAKGEKPEEAKSGKKVWIKTLVIEGSSASIVAPLLNGKGVEVPLPKIVMVDIGKEEGNATIAEEMKLVLTTMWVSVMENAKDLPGAITDSLKGALGSVLGAAGSALNAIGADRALKAAGGLTKDVGTGAKDTVSSAAKGVGKAAEGVGTEIKGLFRKDKKEKKK